METQLEDLLDSLLTGKALDNWQNNIDIIEDDTYVAIVIDVPGYESDGIDISTERNILTISGKRKLEESVLHEKVFLRRGRTSTSFSRSIQLPNRLNADKIKATIKNGVLRVEIEKVVPAVQAAKKILVQNG
jgi:HSP20 family protein